MSGIKETEIGAARDRMNNVYRPECYSGAYKLAYVRMWARVDRIIAERVRRGK